MDSLDFSNFRAWLDVAAMVLFLYALAYAFHHYVALSSTPATQTQVLA